MQFICISVSQARTGSILSNHFFKSIKKMLKNILRITRGWDFEKKVSVFVLNIISKHNNSCLEFHHKLAAK